MVAAGGYYLEALEFAEERDKAPEMDKDLLLDSYFGLGNFYNAIKKYKEALKMFYKARDIYDEVHSSEIQKWGIEYRMAFAKFELGEFEDAIAILKSILNQFKEEGRDSESKAVIFINEQLEWFEVQACRKRA